MVGFGCNGDKDKNFYERNEGRWVRLTSRNGIIEEGKIEHYNKTEGIVTLHPYVDILYPQGKVKRSIVDREMEITTSAMDIREITTRKNIRDKCDYINKSQWVTNTKNELELGKIMPEPRIIIVSR